MATARGETAAGNWQLGDRLGRGAFADVIEGVDERTGERAAVKILRDVEPTQRARLEREIIALEALDHPGIVRVLDHGELNGRPFIVLERVDGGSLADELAAGGAVAPGRAAAIGAALADALAHAHRRGVVHRDVKPSNVLLDADGRPRLADFGVALLHGTGGLTATGFTVGTAAYVAPEQVRGMNAGPPADIYALGLLLLELVTGERAYPGAGFVAAAARLERAPTIPPSVPAPLAACLRAMTAMDPDDRPPAAAVATQLAVLADDDAAPDGTALLPTVDEHSAAADVRSNASIAVVCFVAGFVIVFLLRLLF